MKAIMKREVAQLLEDIRELERMPEIEKRRYSGLKEVGADGQNMHGMQP